MSQFTAIDIVVDVITYRFIPYDRGANGAFVYRENVVGVHAPRAVVSTSTNDTASDKMTVQLNTPQTCPSVDCGPDLLLGTDLVKTELRFLATTGKQSRALQIDKQIALLQELRNTIEDRSVIYS